MSLIEYPALEQGSDDWHDARRGIVTASVVGKLITPTLKVASNDTSRGVTTTLVAERISGFTEDTPMNSDMWRGVAMEPIARDLYAEHHLPVTEIGFMRREESWGTLGYSPDGLVGDDGLIEIKAPRAKGHITTILADRVPPFYMAQCQAGLLVSGRKWLDFVSYCGGLPLYVKRVHPLEEWQDAIVSAVVKFEHEAAEMRFAYDSRIAGLPPTERIEPFMEASI